MLQLPQNAYSTEFTRWLHMTQKLSVFVWSSIVAIVYWKSFLRVGTKKMNTPWAFRLNDWSRLIPSSSKIIKFSKVPWNVRKKGPLYFLNVSFLFLGTSELSKERFSWNTAKHFFFVRKFCHSKRSASISDKLNVAYYKSHRRQLSTGRFS